MKNILNMEGNLFRAFKDNKVRNLRESSCLTSLKRNKSTTPSHRVSNVRATTRVCGFGNYPWISSAYT